MPVAATRNTCWQYKLVWLVSSYLHCVVMSFFVYMFSLRWRLVPGPDCSDDGAVRVKPIVADDNAAVRTGAGEETSEALNCMPVAATRNKCWQYKLVWLVSSYLHCVVMSFFVYMFSLRWRLVPGPDCSDDGAVRVKPIVADDDAAVRTGAGGAWDGDGDSVTGSHGYCLGEFIFFLSDIKSIKCGSVL